MHAENLRVKITSGSHEFDGYIVWNPESKNALLYTAVRKNGAVVVREYMACLCVTCLGGDPNLAFSKHITNLLTERGLTLLTSFDKQEEELITQGRDFRDTLFMRHRP